MKKIIFLIVLVLLYVSFKTFCFFHYKDVEGVTDVNLNGNITVNKVELNEEDYIKIDSIKIKNIFDGYVKRENEDVKGNIFILYSEGEEEKVDKSIMLGEDEQYVNLILKDDTYSKNFDKIAKKYNIKNDIDLLNYYENHKDDEVSFFMTFCKQKEINTMNQINAIIFPSIKYTKLIDGDYSGYVNYMNGDKIKEVILLKDNKRYYMTFIGDYSEEYITDVISSVVFE